MVLFLQEELSDTSKEIKGTGDASVAAKSDKTLSHLAFLLGLTNALEVDHADVELLQFVEKGHVVVLSLDRVREEEVSLVSQKVWDGYFFNTKDYRGRRNVLVDLGAGIDELIVTVASNCGGLDDDLDVLGHDLLYLKRGEGAATFPLVFALSEDGDSSYRICFDHLDDK